MNLCHKKPQENALPDDYPIYLGYLYVVDGKVVQSMENSTVGTWKRVKGCKQVTSCDIAARDLWHLMV